MVKDNAKLFEHQSDGYQKYRPTYPDELFEFIVKHCVHREVVWDCAAGSGQASVKLARYFDRVIATDAQKNQLDHAVACDNVTYCLAPAEKTALPSDSVDCITVAQTLHWFANDDFFQEAKRVGKPGAVVAAWCYPLLTVDDPTIDKILRDFYDHSIKPFWAKGRHYIDDRYSTIPFKFKEKQVASFFSEVSWDLKHFLGYVATWSAVQCYIEKKKENPVEVILQPALEKVWSNGNESKNMRFEFICLLGRV